MSCLQRLNTLEENIWTDKNVRQSWRHTTLWMAPCQYSVAHGVCHIIYANMPCGNLRWSITRSFLPQMCIALEVVFLKLPANLTPGWAFIPVKFDLIQKIGPKVRRGWAPFHEWVLFRKTMVHAIIVTKKQMSSYKILLHNEGEPNFCIHMTN